MKYAAKFTPQAWVNDYATAVDPEGPTEWDCTAYMLRQTPEDRAAILAQPDQYISDYVARDESAPQWVRDWSGPFYVEVEEAA